MEFTVKFNMDNAAFTDYPEAEVSRILNKAIDQVNSGNMEGLSIVDINGNKVGRWDITD